MMLSKVKTRGYCGINLTCELTSSCIDDEEYLRYTTYGMRVLNSDGSTVFSRTDIATDKSLVEEIVCACNSCGASVMHVLDVIEDFMA